MSSYPLDRAVRLATRNAAIVQRRFPELLEGCELHDTAMLEKFCRDQKITVLHRPLPGVKAGIALEVHGKAFIILDDEKVRHAEMGFVFGHEIAHVILGHLRAPNFAMAGFSETEMSPEVLLAALYQSEQELGADLLSMVMLLPDGLFHREVERSIYIPVRRISDTVGLSTQLVAARVHLYRQIFGYQRTEQLSRQQHEGDFSLGGAERQRREEFAGRDGLISYLPPFNNALALGTLR